MKTLILTLAAMMSLAASAQEVYYMHVHKGDNNNNIVRKAGDSNGSTYSESNLSNFWVTNGGTCRTVRIDDEGVQDVTLDVMIDNDSTQYKENEFDKIKYALQRVRISDGSWYVAVPVEFDVNGDESIVDHYELCGYNHLKNNTYPIMTARDNDWTGNPNLKEATENPTNTMRIEKQGGEGFHHYNCYTINQSKPYNDKGGINYSVVPTYHVGAETAGDIVLTIYVKTYYNNGLEPTYHSLNNVKYSIQKIVTAIDDINMDMDDSQATYYDLMGNQVMNPEQGIFIKKVGNKATKIKL